METSNVKIDIDLQPSLADEQVVHDGLRRHNDGYRSTAGDVAFAVFLRGSEGHILGGLLAKAGRGWLHIKTLWVDPGLRGQGYGSRLLAAAEEEGRRRGCHGAYLDTFSFQARPFYERFGYEVFGTLDDFPAGHQRFFMRKPLI